MSEASLGYILSCRIAWDARGSLKDNIQTHYFSRKSSFWALILRGRYVKMFLWYNRKASRIRQKSKVRQGRREGSHSLLRILTELSSHVALFPGGP